MARAWYGMAQKLVRSGQDIDWINHFIRAIKYSCIVGFLIYFVGWVGLVLFLLTACVDLLFSFFGFCGLGSVRALGDVYYTKRMDGLG
ncbi:hypothetical protein F4809DRAFT_597585 [Biscogniauxia mediterranea]|nr:hypothetical protein F4809DRAFT_597585 [Biscogniauxia mediterranea]